MDAEDIGKDILFPQRALGLLRSDDRDFIAACFCAYNEIVMDHVKPHRDRLFPIGFLPYWDEASVREGGAQLKDLGFKAMMMPSLPPGVFYNSRQLDGMWTAIEKTGLPLSFHVGETFDARGLGGLATTVVVAFGGYRRLWSLLTFSGILERHLGLRFVYEEAEPSVDAGEAEVETVDLARLPERWRRQLHEAASRADGETVVALLDGLAGTDAEAARGVRALASDFQFSVIMRLTEV